MNDVYCTETDEGPRDAIARDEFVAYNRFAAFFSDWVTSWPFLAASPYQLQRVVCPTRARGHWPGERQSRSP